MNRLGQILKDKRLEIAGRQEVQPLERLGPAPAGVPGFSSSLLSVPMGLVAEVKRRSPSAGPIREPFDAPAIARAYRDAGAQAISCLVDHAYFGGGEEDFLAVRAAAGLPQLYKEFVVDPWQVHHARALGASAVLLIVAALTPDELERFYDLVSEQGMETLVEVHDDREMEAALELGAQVIGINNRNLKTFEVTLDTTVRLAGMAGGVKLLVSESGIRGPGDVAMVREAGCRAVLVGEHLLRQEDPGMAVKKLMGAAWASS